MAGGSIGSIFVELDLDSTAYTRKQKEIVAGANAASLDIEKNWKTIGATSDVMYTAMKQNITNAYDAIKNKASSSSDEIRRAHEAADAKITSINTAQFGAQTTMLDKLKANWIAATVAIAAAMAVLSTAKEYMELGAKAQQAADSFELVGKSAGYSATELEAFKKKMSEAAAGTVDDSDIMQKAVKGMVLGLDLNQMVKIMDAARIAARVAGEDVKTAYEKITDAIATGMPKALRQYGLVSKEEAAAVTAALAAGVTGIDLYKIAMTNAAIQAAKFGDIHDTVAEKMQRQKAIINEAKETIGNYMIALTASAITYVTTSTEQMLVMKGMAAQSKIMSAEEQAASTTRIAAMETEKAANLAKLKAETDAAVHAKQIEAEKKAVIEETSKAMTALTKVMQEYGAEQVKIAGTAFTTALKDQAAILEEINKKMESKKATLSDLQTGEAAYITATMAGLTTYLAKVEEVFAARIAGEKAVAKAMEDSGALTTPKAQLEAQAAILKTEKEYLTTRLAGWQTYYDALASQHAKATESMKTKEKELTALQEAQTQSRVAGQNTMLGLQEKMAIANGKAASDESIYDAKRVAAEAIYTAAMNTSGEARIKLLNEYIAKQGDLTAVVTTQGTFFNVETMKWETGLKTVKTAQDAISTAMTNTQGALTEIDKAQDALVQAKQKEIETNRSWAAELSTAMATAKGKMTEYTGQITKLSELMLKMDKEIAMTVSDKATGPLTAIKALLDSIQNKTVTVTVSTSGAGAGAGGTASGETTYSPEYQGYAGYDPGSVDSGGGGWMADAGGYGSHAMGDVFDAGNVIPFAGGGIVDRPTFFPMAKGTGLMGEAGPEAIIPLARKSDGSLGIKGGGQVINLGGITIVGTNKSPEQLAREIVKPLKEELRRLQATGG